MFNSFGALLRRLRFASGRTMSEMAKMLDVSSAFVSDVERGNRAPFTADKIKKVASFLEIREAGALFAAAADVKGCFELSTQGSRTKHLFASELAACWEDLTDEQIRELWQHLPASRP